MKKSVKLLSVILAVILTAVSLPLGAFATETPTHFQEEDDEKAGSTVRDDVFEIVEQRDACSKQVHLADGSILLAAYAVPVHRQDADGAWQDIDNALSLTGNAYRTGDGRIRFSQTVSGNESLFTLRDGKYEMSVTLEGAIKNTKGEETTNREDAVPKTEAEKITTLSGLSSEIIYKDILDGVDLQYKVISNNIKENILIRQRNSQYQYAFLLELNHLTAELEEDGNIVLTDDETGKLFGVFPKGFMIDAAGSRSDQVFYSLTDLGNGRYEMAVWADAQWIEAPERVFPVTIDPPFYTTGSQITDTYVNSAYPNTSYGSSVSLLTGTGRDTYVKFSTLTTLPNSALVTSASLQLRVNNAANPTGYIGAYQVTSSWDGTLTYNQVPASGATSSTVLDYCSLSSVQSGDYCVWDITAAVQSWYNGTSNYGIALKGISMTGSVGFDSVEATGAANRPLFTATFSDIKGVEAYYSMTNQGAGFAGTGYVNNANGKLVFLIDTLSAQDSLFGFTPGLVFNSYIAGSYYTASNSRTTLKTASAGYGFKLNMSETVRTEFPTSPTGGLEMRYVLTDSDGTEHYFLAVEENNTTVYKDEDGLGLTMTEDSTDYIITDTSHTVRRYQKYNTSTSYIDCGGILRSITDKNGNALTFTLDTRGRVTEIKMTPNNSTAITFFKISYNSSGLVNIIRNAVSGEAYGFYYSTSASYGTPSITGSGYLRKMERVHQTILNENDWATYGSGGTVSSIVSDATAEYKYSSAGMMTSAADNYSQKTLKYTYSSGKVATAYETAGSSSATGQKIGFTYYNGATEIRSSGKDDVYNNTDDIITRYVFDRRGRTVSAYSTKYTRDIIYGASSGAYVSREENANASNHLKTTAVLGGSSVNYLVNGGFEMSDTVLTGWTAVNDVELLSDTYNGRRVKIREDSSIYQNVSLSGGTYTLSAEFNSAIMTDSTVKLRVVYASDSSIVFEKLLAESEGASNGEYRFDSLTFTVVLTGMYTVSILNSDGEETLIVDNVMLERNAGAGDVSLVANGGFNNGNGCWIYTGGSACTTGTWSSPSELGSVLRLGSGIGTVSYVYQDLWDDPGSQNSQNTGARSFLVSGFGRAENPVQSESVSFAIAVQVRYRINQVLQDPVNYIFPFCKDTDQWQFVSGSFTVPAGAVICDMVVFCDYSGNTGYGYFDNISLCPVSGNDVTNNKYYPDGRLFMTYTSSRVVAYQYNEAGDILKQIDDENTVEYTYGTSFRVTQEKHYKHPNRLSSADSTFEEVLTRAGTATWENTVDYQYIDCGLCEKTEISAASITKKIKTDNVYEVTPGSPIFGALLESTDSYDQTTRYFYDSTHGYLLAEIRPDENGLCYEYDALGRMTLVRPAVLSGNTYQEIDDSAEVDYSYTGSLLTGIESDRTQYTLAYDLFGNTSSVQAGTNTLAGYEYNTYNGKLKKLTYGNGDYVDYRYDALDRVSSILYNGVETYRYSYDSNGNLYRVEDLIAQTARVYRCDRQNRIINYYEYSLTDQSLYYEANVGYGADQRISYRGYSFNGLANTFDGTLDYLTSFTYHSDGTLDTYKTEFDVGKSYRSEPTFDKFGRTVSKVVTLYRSLNQSISNTVGHTYKNSGTNTGPLISQYVSTVGNTVTTYQYEYDSNGNITQIKDGSGNRIVQYTYDDLGRLIREDNTQYNQSYTWEYDKAGNIKFKKTYSYTTGALGSPSNTKAYTYGNSNWGDLLTAYSGQPVTYDEIGNPLTYYNGTAYTFTWEQGRRLATSTSANNALTYTYNDEGYRTSKTVNGVTHEYLLDGSRILTESWGSELLVYVYDETGAPIGMRYRKSTYAEGVYDDFLFEKNLQGDVIAVYNAVGTKIASYKYGAYGNVSRTMTSGYSTSPAKFNPFRYRSYYYDEETGFYYLQSRYYDPVTGRFINADGQLNEGLFGYNLFAYCGNNPVNSVDPTGECFWHYWIAHVVIAVAVSAIIYVVESIPSKEDHYARNIYQDDFIDSLGETEEQRISTIKDDEDNWIRKEGGANIYHKNTIGTQGEDAKYNIKYLHISGKYEVIICSKSENEEYIVTDPFNRGTYNFGTAWYEHFAKDMVPYYLWGNGPEDSGFQYLPRRIIGADLADFFGYNK